MRYRTLGTTGLQVSEIGFGGEWLERHTQQENNDLFRAAHDAGVNILDCWMCNPEVRTSIGNAIAGMRKDWIIQGHFGSVWHQGQYLRTRDIELVKPAFEDYLQRFNTDYIDIGMIHYVDDPKEFQAILDSPFLRYVQQMQREGIIHHIGMSTHNPTTALMAAQSGIVEMLMFSINPAFDMLPPQENIEVYFKDTYEGTTDGIDPQRQELYRYCDAHDIGITVMKPFAGGRLFNATASPFGVPLTPIQCIHYTLTRPAVASVLTGYETIQQMQQCISYETATDEQKDYATVLASAPTHAFSDGKCTYCGHCAPCPMHIDIPMVNKLLDLALMQDTVPQSLQSHYDVLQHHANDCISCGQCSSRCPFKVDVPTRMEQCTKVFGH